MRIAAFLALFLLALSFPAPAALPSEKDKYAKDVATVESYLNSVKTLKARFIQTAPNGKQVAGDFLLRRPGRMRFEYDAPVTDFIVADGIFVHYYDGEMKQGSRTLISKSLADFFLREKLTLSGDLEVTGIQRDRDMLLVTLTESTNKNAGSLTLGFAEKPALALKKWRIRDADGGETEVELFSAVTGIKLDRDLFHYYDPEKRKPNYN